MVWTCPSIQYCSFVLAKSPSGPTVSSVNNYVKRLQVSHYSSCDTRFNILICRDINTRSLIVAETLLLQRSLTAILKSHHVFHLTSCQQRRKQFKRKIQDIILHILPVVKAKGPFVELYQSQAMSGIVWYGTYLIESWTLYRTPFHIM